jgi:hypothetical protein
MNDDRDIDLKGMMNAKAIATIIFTFFAPSVQEETFLFRVHLYEN